ncbi:MAG: hypothetical protein NC204_05300 [Candidatus Amulumruptor caecigallinarius]|nr:hypothetical protein [Candidatus Amulumruptor caecigallinarius]
MFKNKYFALWILLSVALLIVVALSFVDDIRIGEKVLKKAPFAEILQGKSSGDADSILAPIEHSSVPDVEVKVDSGPQSLFIFGDSMTFNLALRLAQYAKQNGHTIHSVNWDSSNTKIWAEHDTLARCLARYKPTQVFISLGSNELYFKDPSSRLSYVKKILSVLDTIPYVWIGPPNWKEDTGINNMLERACRPGSFFRSEGMTFKRKADNIHPTRQSSAEWVDSIMRWLPKSAHPFVADLPSDTIGKCNPHIVFLKALK